MPVEEYLAPPLTERTAIISDIMDAFRDLEVEELEAIEKYCHNYHHLYQKRGKKYIITEITLEPMKSKDEETISHIDNHIR